MLFILPIFLLVVAIIGVIVAVKTYDDDNIIAGISTGVGILAGVGTVVAFFVCYCNGFTKISNVTEYKEEALASRENINIASTAMINDASTISTVVDKNTSTYNDVMNAVETARKSNYSAQSIDNCYSIIIAKECPSGVDKKQWDEYVSSTTISYNSVIYARREYNSKVKEYRQQFTASNKALYFIDGCDETLNYYSLDYTTANQD